MNTLIGKDWFVISAVGLTIFFISYLWLDKAIAFLHQKSLGKRGEIILLMQNMLIDVDLKKVTWAMLLCSFGFGLLIFFVLWPHVVLGLIAGSIVTVVGWSIPKTVVMSLYERRAQSFVNQMVDALTVMANGLKAGLTVEQSLGRVRDNMPNPISQEFGRIITEMQLGKSLNDALTDLAARLPKQDVQMFVLTTNILRESGGNMAEPFQIIVQTIRERQKIERKIEAMTAQGMMQGLIVSLIPIVIIAIMLVIDPDFIMPMFTTPIGIVLLMIMVGLVIAGGIAIRKIVKIDV